MNQTEFSEIVERHIWLMNINPRGRHAAAVRAEYLAASIARDHTAALAENMTQLRDDGPGRWVSVPGSSNQVYWQPDTH